MNIPEQCKKTKDYIKGGLEEEDDCKNCIFYHTKNHYIGGTIARISYEIAFCELDHWEEGC